MTLPELIDMLQHAVPACGDHQIGGVLANITIREYNHVAVVYDTPLTSAFVGLALNVDADGKLTEISELSED